MKKEAASKCQVLAENLCRLSKESRLLKENALMDKHAFRRDIKQQSIFNLNND